MTTSEAFSLGPYVWTREKWDFLKKAGILRSQDNFFDEWITISTRLLVPSTSDTCQQAWSTLGMSNGGAPAASLRLKNFVNPLPAKVLKLPKSRESVEMLEFMGFERATAERIYQRWAHLDASELPCKLLQYAVGRVSHKRLWHALQTHGAVVSDDDYMTSLGYRKEFRDAILDPQFASIFETDKLDFWIQDTMSSRYHTVLYLHRRCHNMAMSGHQGLRRDMPAQGRTVSNQSSMSGIMKDLEFPEANVRVMDPVAALTDHVTLYQGRAAHTDQEGFYRWLPPLIRSDGTIKTEALKKCVGDFNQSPSVATYWTPERETAELYRSYAERRDAHTETWIVSIQVPNSFLDTLRHESLWYSPEWKEYVWHCRHGHWIENHSHLGHIQQAQVIEGRIARKLPQVDIEEEDLQTTVVADDFLLFYKDAQGRNAICSQWAFIGHDTLEQLSEAVRGKVHIDVYASKLLRVAGTIPKRVVTRMR